VTDDTPAVQKTINDAAAMLQAGGSPGPIYFPPSLHPCKVDTITFPSVSEGWLYSLFDNGLYANHINIGSFNAYVGRTSNFGGGGTLFAYGPSAKWFRWQKPTNIGPFVDLNGVSEAYYDPLHRLPRSSVYRSYAIRSLRRKDPESRPLSRPLLLDA